MRNDIKVDVALISSLAVLALVLGIQVYFSDAPENREYEQFCSVQFDGKTEKEVDTMFADRDLGKELHKKLREKVASNKTNGYASVLCCSPRRDAKNDLKFWINTGRSTNIDGWKSEEDINNFLNGDGKVVDGR